MNKLESSEDYLERILMLTQKNGTVRSIDIANDMGFSKPSVSIAMKKLRENGYLSVDEDGLIRWGGDFVLGRCLTLTAQGLAIAEYILNKHNFLKKLLISIGVSPETAEDDACKIEHEISDETFQRLVERFK